jgi:hypothetical protein
MSVDRAAAEHCLATAFMSGECDRVQWGALLWSLAFIPTTIIIIEEAGQ